jgi:UDP-N-acetylglucosamine 4,6-dehydratase
MTTSLLSLIGRQTPLFTEDIESFSRELSEIISGASFLVLGGAGSIGQAVSKEVFKRQPKKLHVVDLSENNLTELVRDLRSSFGYLQGEFKTFALDIGSVEYDAFIRADGVYDYVLNLSALKHVRSEKDPFTLMRLLDVNVFQTDKTLQQSIQHGVKKYFCVSTDKASSPVNLMGASKRIMELFLMRRSLEIPVSTARFANVAFSDGSLLHGFQQRLTKHQPIAAPNDIKRYFVTAQESGELCLMSCLFGNNRDIFFPKLNASQHLESFADIAEKYLQNQGYQPYLCATEDEARELIHSLPQKGQWPCLFSSSNTTGEKAVEVFYNQADVLDRTRFADMGVIQSPPHFDEAKLNAFSAAIHQLKQAGCWDKTQLVEQFFDLIPDLNYQDKGRYLDGKM